MQCLARLSLSCTRTPFFVGQLAPIRLAARSFSVTCPRDGDSLHSGCKELDELLLGVSSDSDKVSVLPASETLSSTASESLSTLASETLSTSYTSPLTGQSTSILSSPTNDYVSPFASTDKMDYTNLLEPSFQSLGLGHSWPSGWMQTLLEYLHIDLGLPWWQTIVVTTVCIRIFVFPFMVKAQKNMVNMNNNLPYTQKLQVEAQLSAMKGETDKAAFANDALNNYMALNNCHPANNMLPLIVNGVVMTSMFFALRGMTNAPVASMTTGGTAWFTDLVASDPTFVLPLTAAGTIGLMMYFGADGVNLDTMPPIMKKIMIGLPIVSIPVMIAFPAALTVYWVTNNFISLGQSALMRRPAVRKYFAIGELIKWKPGDLPMTNFFEVIKTEQANQKKAAMREDAAKVRNRIRIEEQENKIRGRLLEGFTKEDKERLKHNAEKRLNESKGRQ